MSLAGPGDPTPVRGSRAARGARRRHRRLAIGAAVVAAALGLWYLSSRDGGSGEAGPSPSGTATQRPQEPRMLALSVTGAPHPLMAVIGAGPPGPGAALPIPMDLNAVVPGSGEMDAVDIARLPGASMQVALSNIVGAWNEAYAVMPLKGLAAAIDREGGLTVDLPRTVSTNAGVLGPGEVVLSGAQVRALLASPDDASLHWDLVLGALLETPPTVESSDMSASNGAELVTEVWAGAAGGRVESFPVQIVAGTVPIAQQPQLDELVGATFGTPTPIPVIVQNGNGTPGVGEQVARAVIPAGFRVVLSQNAGSFGLPSTDVIANGPENIAAARQARKALGVGRVGVSQVPSGIGDVLIVVGEDFTA